MSRRKDPTQGRPRTGDGHKAKGKKPTETGVMQIRNPKTASGSMHNYTQPKGWGVAKVVDIFSKKKRK